MKGSGVTNDSLIYRTAYVCSVLGNPLLISIIFLSAFCLRLLDPSRAIKVIAALACLLFVPISLWIQRRVRSGHYSDFDVSRREDRTRMYPIILGLNLLSTAMLCLTHQPSALSLGMLSVSLMIGVAFLTNRWIKISLHAAFSFFFALAAIKISLSWVAPMLIFAALVASSRLILKRHRAHELVMGATLGILTGCVLLSVLGWEPV
jgi:membrane-associated phospholipid phosphatase